MRRLLDTHGADLVDAVYRDNEWRRPKTPMRSAACAKNDQIIETLIAYGATDLLWDKTRSFWDIKNSLSHERGSEQSEQASERVSAVEGKASKASSPEKANEWAVRANERTDELVTQYLRLDSCLFQTTVRLYSAALTQKWRFLTQLSQKWRSWT